jgi:hypothetical protein
LQRSEEQIFALAPDEASKKAGKDLANPAKWVTRGINEHALWGECQGSGSKPYQTQVDLTSIAFKCSCPSRKFPCKHGIGLLLHESRNPEMFATAEMPVWVADWISKRSEKEIKKAETTDKPVDEAAQAKRQEARTKKVAAGIQELLVWLKDIIRNGILSMPEKGAGYWDNMARRMVDAQATGLGAMIRELASTRFWEENWQDSFMNRLIQIYLIAEGYQHLPNLSENLRQDILNEIGFTKNQDELKAGQGTTDTWLVLGKHTNTEGGLTTEQNWLYGLNSKTCALVLQFYAKGQALPYSVIPGTYIQAELVYFPSSVPFRALIKNITGQTEAGAELPSGLCGWQEMAQLQSRITAQLPFHADIPVIIEKLRPVKIQQEWYLQDQQGYLAQVQAGLKSWWTVLAVSGGMPLTMSIMKKENNYLPIGLWDQQTYITL